MSMDKLAAKTARADLAQVGRQAKRRLTELEEVHGGLQSEEEEVRIGARAILRQIAEELEVNAEELEQYLWAVHGVSTPEPATPAPTPAPTPIAPEPLAEPTPAPPAIQPPTVEPTPAPIPPTETPKDKAPKAEVQEPWWQRPYEKIRNWQLWAWVFALVFLLISVAANDWTNDLARALTDWDSGAGVDAFSAIFSITWSVFMFLLGGTLGEIIDRKVAKT